MVSQLQELSCDVIYDIDMIPITMTKVRVTTSYALEVNVFEMCVEAPPCLLSKQKQFDPLFLDHGPPQTRIGLFRSMYCCFAEQVVQYAEKQVPSRPGGSE